MADTLFTEVDLQKLLLERKVELSSALNGGTVGPPGPQGEQGIQGLPGADGSQGYPGDPGAKGDTGDTGLQGLPGNDGVPGAKGDTGDAGTQGIQGIQGPPGADSTVPGPQGDQGIQGIQGIQGVPGADSTVPGPQGDQGIQGIQGIQGDVGPQGIPGISNYALIVHSASQSTTTDSQTMYWGGFPVAPNTTADRWRVYIPKAGTIIAARIFSYAGTAGSNENWSMYIRKNNTSDTLIQTLAVNTNARVWANDVLSIAVVAGDYIEIKEIQPAWGTNPATVTRTGVVYLE